MMKTRIVVAVARLRTRPRGIKALVVVPLLSRILLQSKSDASDHIVCMWIATALVRSQVPKASMLIAPPASPIALHSNSRSAVNGCDTARRSAMQRYPNAMQQGRPVGRIVASQMPFQVVFQSPSALTETAVSDLFSDPHIGLL
jgi:hypothetical protein